MGYSVLVYRRMCFMNGGFGVSAFSVIFVI